MSMFQVTNLADAVKIACDFVSIPAISSCVKVQAELRKHRLAVDHPAEVLPVYCMLYDAYQTVNNVRTLEEHAELSGQ